MDNTISQFSQITGADIDTSRFFVESSGGNLEMALSTFFEGGSGQQVPQQRAPQQQQPPQQQQQPVQQQKQTPTSSQSSSKPKSKPSGGLMTLSDLKNEEEEDEDQPQAYFAGGEKSGQQILDPRKKPNANDITEQVFNKAKERGAKSIDEVEQDNNNKSFSGAGYRLGFTGSSTNQPSKPIPETVKKEKTVTLSFYKNGFTVDDGPLRKYDDPANHSFLDEINKGYVPREIQTKPGEEVSVHLIDKKGEDWSPPPVQFQAFTGGGRALGSTASTTQTSSSSSNVNTVQNTPQQKSGFKVDPNQPTTTIQIRLHDGTRLVSQFNPNTHTVADLRNFVAMAKPLAKGQVFELINMSAHPRKTLTDFNQTLADANLQSGVVLQSLK